jgi:hypothetical protein
MPDDQNYPAPPPELKQRVQGSLRANGVLRRTPHWSRAPLAIAAGVALFLAGAQYARLGTSPANSDPIFTLLLYEDAAFQPQVPVEEIVREYTAWAHDLRDRGALVLAEELDPVVHLAGADAPVTESPLGQLTGMFVVHAADRDAAMELARDHPHVRHGGRIVVRGVVSRES